MKKIFSLVLICILCLSMFTIFTPKARADSSVQQLPAGAMYSNQGLSDGTILQSLSIAGQGQIATVNPGQSVSVSYTMHIWAPVAPGEIRQAFFAYSWASSWPPLDAYTAIYNGIPGLYPGVTLTDTFTITVPTTPGTYNLWFLGESQYSMNNAVALFTTVPPVTAYAKIIVVASNPEGYWKFDEGSGLIAHDSSGNGNDGAINGANWSAGISNEALQFDGVSNYVGISNSPSLALLGNQMSLELWIEPTVTLDSSLASRINIIDKGDGYGFQMEASDGRISFYVNTGGDQWLPTVTSNWKAGTWYHIVGTYDGSSESVYVNGVLENTRSLSGALSGIGCPLSIGSYCYGTMNFFNGAIDEVKVFNYARSADEIAQDYQSLTGPVGYWKFDEGSGSVAHDSSGNGNDGIIHDATWTSGKMGNALHFNGVDSWVEIPNSLTLTGLSQITLEAWIQEDSINSELKGIISKCDGYAPPTNAEYFLGTNDNGRILFDIDNKVSIAGNNPSAHLITEAGRWYHVAGTWSGYDYAIYVNGIQVFSGTCTPQTTGSNSLPVQIGRHGTWSWVYFLGIIDEVEIYDRALTANEILADYLVGSRNVLFSDNFENYAVGTFPSSGGWQLVYNGMGDQYQIVTNEYSVSPTQSLQLWGNPGDWSALAQKHFSSASRYIGYDVSMLISAIGTGGPGRVDYVGFFNQAAGPWGRYYATIQFNHDTKNIITDDGRIVGNWATGEWYQIEVLLDRDTNTYRVWINGQLRGNDFNCTNQDTNIINAFSLQSDHPGVKDYFDDVSVFEVNLEPTTLNITVYDESGFPPASGNGANVLPGIPLEIYTLGNILVANGTTDSHGTASFSLQQGSYNISYGGVIIPGWGKFAVTSKLVDVYGSSRGIDLYCPEVTYHVYSEGGPFELNYVDLDVNTPDYQGTINVQPGQLVNAEFSWWELETVNVPVWYVSVFGDWAPTAALGNLGSGTAAPSSHNLHTVQLAFNAPATPGTYQVRMVGVLDYDWPNSFYTGNHYQPSQGRDTTVQLLGTSVDEPCAIGTIVVGGSQITHKLTVYSDHGSPVPPAGDNVYGDGQSVTCSVTSPVVEEGMVWTCTGWTGTGSVLSSGEGTSITFTINEDSSITWHWNGVPVQYGLNVQTSGSGTTNATGVSIYDSDTIVAVQASPANGWTLSYWLRNNTNIGSVNPCVITMNENINLTAFFAQTTPIQWKLTVSSSHDSPNPGVGDHLYDDGTSVTCSVLGQVTEGSMMWTCSGWTGTGSVPASGNSNSVTFSITQNSTITWNWQGAPVQHILTVFSAHDNPIPSSSPHNYNDGQSVTCSATSPVTEGSTVWTCTGWTGTGSVPSSGSSTSVTFTITQDSSITWNWQGSAVQRTLTVSSAHDTPVPGNGPHSYGDGQSVTCSVTSPVTEGNTFWTCTGWTGAGSVPSSGGGKTVTFMITQDSSITWNWQGQPVYSVGISTHCNSEGKDISVSVWIDTSTAYTTPYTFTNLHGVHTFTASQYDTSAHSFKQWNTGSTSLTITVSSGGTYIAYYEAVQRTLTVSSAHDTPVPGNGPHNYVDGQSVTCSVSNTVTEGSNIWTCTGWSGTGSVPSSGSGTSTSFIMTKDSTITWNWQSRPIGDLVLVDFSPVQVVYGASELVANKPAAFRAIVQSTFSQIESTSIRFTYSGGSSADYQLQIGSNTQISLFIPFTSTTLHQKGTFTWTASLDPDNKIIETNEGNNMFTSSKTVIETNYLSILYVPLYSYKDQPISTTDLKLMEKYGDQYIFETYPTPGIYSQIADPMVLNYIQCNFVTLSNTLANLDKATKQSGFDRCVVILPNANGHWLLQNIFLIPSGWDHPGLAPSAYSSVCLVENGYYGDIAHEIGHTYGLRLVSEEYNLNPPGNVVSGYDPGRGVKIENGLCFMGAVVAWIKLGDQIPQFKMGTDPHNYGPYGGGYWICNDDYEILLGKFKKVGDPEAIYMGGIIFENDTTLLTTWSIFSTSVPDVPPGNSGNFQILFLDDMGSVIDQTGLNVSSIYLPGEFITPFSFTVEYPSSTRQVQLWLDDNLIVEKNVSLNPPSISDVSPHGGEIFTAGDNCLISWTGSDIDGDQLTYDVFYSADGGAHWIPLAFDLNQTTLLWDTSNMAKGSDYLVRVIANDGLNTAEIISESSFTIKAHDIASSTIVPSKSIVGQNSTMSFDTTIENHGDFLESTNITVCANETVVGTAENVSLIENATLSFLWNTIGIGYGNYTITSYAQPVLGETNIYDNNCTCGISIHVGVPGDVSSSILGVYDGTTNMKDIAYLVSLFNTRPASPNWNPNADINNDGVCNMKDIAIAVLNFNQHE
jgi:hypothetical protein